MLVPSHAATSMGDLIVGNDMTWCFRGELEFYPHMPDEIIVIAEGTEAWSEFLNKEEAENDPLLDALDTHYDPS